MIIEIEVGGRSRQVSIEPVGRADGRGGRFRIAVLDPLEQGRPDEQSASPLPFIVDGRVTDVGWSLVMPDGRSIDAAVSARGGGEFLVQLPHVDVAATVDGRARRPAGPIGTAGSGQQRIVAPMPGRVLRVLVTVGDEVVERQGLLVIEAMKMENQLSAVRAGRVTEVTVSAGSSVESGRLLVVIE